MKFLTELSNAIRGVETNNTAHDEYHRNDNDNDDNNNGSLSSSSYLSSLWHGLGLFGESYLLFSVGTLRPFWETLYPECFDINDDTTCPNPALSYKAITYSVVLGVMVGMIVLGVLANDIGRRRGSILTATLMAAGAICLTLCSLFLSSSPSVLFPIMSLSLFVFGIGVGGEYPLSAASASERAMASTRRRKRMAAEQHVEKMRQLLTMTTSTGTPKAHGGRNGRDEDPTPLRNNLSNKNGNQGEKSESLLRVDTANANVGTDNTNINVNVNNVNSWQTLETKNDNGNGDADDGNDISKLTPVVEESYGYNNANYDVPLSPTNISNQTGNNSLSTYNASLRTRGRDVLIVFSMQGMGIFANSMILTLLLLAARRKNNNDNNNNDNGNDDDDDEYYYTQTTLLNIWRITYATGAAILIYVLVSRISHLTESEVWAQDKQQREDELREKQNREAEAGVGFQPPQHHRHHNHHSPEGQGPYEKRLRKEEEEKGSRPEQVVISPTMSSLTMRSEFDLLGSTNLDGCKLVPAMMAAAADDDNDDDDDSIGKMMRNNKPSETMLLFRHYGVRLFGTSITWLLWDIAYYGNKLFQSSFLIALTGEDASLVDITCASAVNAFVALMGYYAAAAIVDDPDCGRLALQQTGFVITGTLFLLCGTLNDRLSSTWLVVMYFSSSFFGQCGPNCTTFLIPAEVFPTNKRAMCHGISASAGKLGALIASILFNYVSEKELFLFSGYASFAASLITFLTIPETTTLDLYEIDKQWHGVLCNERYEGPATDPRHLSFYERNQNRLCCTRSSSSSSSTR